MLIPPNSILNIPGSKPKSLLNIAEESRVNGYLIRANDDAFGKGRRVFHPGVGEDRTEIGTLVGVDFEDGADEVEAFAGEVVGGFVLAGEDLLVQLFGVGVLEGEVAAHHRVGDDPRGPQVDSPALVPLVGDHLGRGVAGRAAGRLEQLAGLVGV
jgi:hypothetical protein